MKFSPQLRRLMHPLRAIKWWQLLIVIVLFSATAVIGLRDNSQRMGGLKQQVIEADQQGEAVYERLAELANFVYAHMNTSTEIDLPGEYQRAYDAQVAELTNTSGSQQLYEAARAECDTAQVSLPQRAACVQRYVEARSESSNVDLPEPPRPEPYSFSFSAPVLSLDVAGVSIILASTSALLLIGKLTHNLVIKNYRS